LAWAEIDNLLYCFCGHFIHFFVGFDACDFDIEEVNIATRWAGETVVA
jgi:hypothetical protein